MRQSEQTRQSGQSVMEHTCIQPLNLLALLDTAKPSQDSEWTAFSQRQEPSCCSWH